MYPFSFIFSVWLIHIIYHKTYGVCSTCTFKNVQGYATKTSVWLTKVHNNMNKLLHIRVTFQVKLYNKKQQKPKR